VIGREEDMREEKGKPREKERGIQTSRRRNETKKRKDTRQTHTFEGTLERTDTEWFAKPSPHLVGEYTFLKGGHIPRLTTFPQRSGGLCGSTTLLSSVWRLQESSVQRGGGARLSAKEQREKVSQVHRYAVQKVLEQNNNNNHNKKARN
jgi:hypothetical protein